MTGPALYRHFAGKDSVLAAVLSDTAEVVAQSVGHLPPTENVDDLVTEFVVLSLDSAAGIATLLREHARAPRDKQPLMRAAIAQLYSLPERAVSLAAPELDPFSHQLRVAALVGPLGSGTLGRRDGWLERPALDRVLVDAAARMIAAPSVVTEGDAPSARWRPPVTRRAEIRREALALFRRRGFNAVSVDEIGQAAGVSGPTVYYYFRNKAAILEDGLAHGLQLLTATFDAAINGATSPAHAVDRIVRSVATISLENLDLFSAYASALGPLSMEETAAEDLGLGDILKVWAEILTQARPSISSAEAESLIRMGIPTIFAMAEVCEKQPGRLNEVVAIADALFDVTVKTGGNK